MYYKNRKTGEPCWAAFWGGQAEELEAVRTILDLRRDPIRINTRNDEELGTQLCVAFPDGRAFEVDPGRYLVKRASGAVVLGPLDFEHTHESQGSSIEPLADGDKEREAVRECLSGDQWPPSILAQTLDRTMKRAAAAIDEATGITAEECEQAANRLLPPMSAEADPAKEEEKIIRFYTDRTPYAYLQAMADLASQRARAEDPVLGHLREARAEAIASLEHRNVPCDGPRAPAAMLNAIDTAILWRQHYLQVSEPTIDQQGPLKPEEMGE